MMRRLLLVLSAMTQLAATPAPNGAAESGATTDAVEPALPEWFWLASGRKPDDDETESSGRADMAAESGSFEFRGTHRWTPVSLTLGPIRCDQAKLSFGVLLEGRGDLWIYQPQLQVIDELPRAEAELACRAVEKRRHR